MPDDVGISISYPLPGTVFYEKVKEDLQEKANWTDSDDLALMYKSTFSQKYYKRLHRYVHRKFRRKQRVREIVRLASGKERLSSGSLRNVIAVLYYIPTIWMDQLALKVLK
jgi:anaerobic magnesium-protoporphyrin IX monomethyl ester cyclase